MSQGSFLHSIEKTWSGPLDPRGFPCWACGKLSRCPQAVSSWKGRGSPARQVSHSFGLPKIRRLIPFIPPSQAFDTEPETNRTQQIHWYILLRHQSMDAETGACSSNLCIQLFTKLNLCSQKDVHVSWAVPYLSNTEVSHKCSYTKIINKGRKEGKKEARKSQH